MIIGVLSGTATLRYHMRGPPYRPSFVYDMSDADMDWTYDSCPTRMDIHEVPHPVLFSGECALYSRARETNGVF
jgi:hypothetical protein